MKSFQLAVLLLAVFFLAACGSGGKGFDNSANVKAANSMIRETFESQGFKVTDMQLSKESRTTLKGKVVMAMSGAKAEVMCEATISEDSSGIKFKCK